MSVPAPPEAPDHDMFQMANLHSFAVTRPEKRFRQMIRHLVAHDHLPDYNVSFDPETDMVTFRNRGIMTAVLPYSSWESGLDPEAYNDAREAAPGWDVYSLEREWRQWLGENEIEPKHP